MKKTKDITPRMNNMMTADQELLMSYVPGERPLGESVGGLQMFSDTFKRGYGNNVFGSDQNGIWLGAADFADAPFKAYMSGDVGITKSDGVYRSHISGQGMILYKNDIPQVVIAII